MKKLLSLLLAVSLVAAFFAEVPAFAADEVNISVDAVESVVRGTEGAELAVRVSARPRWGSLQAVITFDPGALCFTGMTLNPELSRQIDAGEPCVFAVNSGGAAEGVVTFGYASAYSADGVEGYFPGEYDYFCVLSFDVPENAPLGFTAVGVGVVELSRDENDESVAVAYAVADGGMTLVCGHEWQTLEDVPATCEDSGSASFVCAKCGETRSEFRPATGHSWSDWEEIKPADCTEGGLEVRVCANDPEHIERRSTDPLGHVWSDWTTVSSATCVAREVQTRVCTRDPSHTETREFGGLDTLNGHAWGEWEEILAPGCTMPAVEMRVCGNDPEHFETREGASAVGHDYVGWTVVSEPGCVLPGEESGRCSRCGAVATRSVSALGHKWCEWETAVPATCASEGVETRACLRCGEPDSRELAIDPEAHAWGEWATVRPATPYEDGEETRVCANDPDHTETRAIPRPVYTVCDVDFDGVITVSDALRALRTAARLDEADELTRAAADADYDREVTVADALIILRVAIGFAR
ncbi:MAG: hypothetical protein IJU94_00445 [Clostridia bacterium]|nr:hypothetical protein [Clostridia bacterium]